MGKWVTLLIYLRALRAFEVKSSDYPHSLIFIMFKFSLFRLIASVLFISGVCILRAESRLYATHAGADGVKLQWHPLVWSDDQVGFALKRRLAGVDDWQMLPGAELLRPSVDYERDWSKLGFNTQQAEQIRKQVESKLPTRPAAINMTKLRAILREAKGLPAGDCIQMMRDGTHAFAWGLGFLDAAALPDVNYEYGLFKCYENGELSKDPISVAKPLTSTDRIAWVRATKAEIMPRLGPGLVKLNWRMPLAEAHRSAIGKFTVERRLEGDKDWITVKDEVPYRVVKQTEARWMISDVIREEMKTRPVYYRITPVDVFQSPMSSWEYVIPNVNEEEPVPEKHGPSGLKAKMVEGRLVLDWVHANAELNHLKLGAFRLREDFGIDRGMRLGGAATREAPLEIEKLRGDVDYVLDAIYEDWDQVETAVSSSETINFAAWLAALKSTER